MSKPAYWLVFVFSLLLCLPFAAQEFNFPHNVFPPQDEQIPGPPNDSANPALCCARGSHRPVSEAGAKAWLTYLQAWRREHWVRMGYAGAQYDRPDLKWTQSSFIQTLMMSQERYFYDTQSGRYTVERYLSDLKRRYGGIDSVLIWPSYPNLGVDARNQFDLIRDMPGGVEGVRAMVDTFHRNGVRVLFAYNPWDRGTRAEPEPDWEALAKLMAAVDADGVNADTMEVVPPAFRAAADATGHPIAFEPENGANSDTDFAIGWNNLTWGYWKYPFEPMISKNKWLETRHMVNVCDRWARDRADSLQAAFFNGVGYESWENIFGVWNSLEDRDAEALRRAGAIERTFAGLLISPGWEPHTPVLQYGIFASKFPGIGQTLWTLVNRNEFALSGRQIKVGYQPGLHFYDVWHGVELKPEVSGDSAALSFEVEPLGYGAILATAELSSREKNLLAEMEGRGAQPLADYPRDWRPLQQHLVDIPATKPPPSAPLGMVEIPAGDFLFEVSGIEIEGGNNPGVDVQMPWESAPQRSHRHLMHIKSFYMDRTPATNAEFKKFLDATHYHPSDDHNFLKDWRNGNFPDGWANKPVTWVSLDDARAYAAWAGKRLPHEWEWQYAAQGSDRRLYPWGNQWDARAMPAPGKGRALPVPEDVGMHASGNSPFGVEDLVGHVWQWTDEYGDAHTRSAILRGGSAYQPQGAMWYFPQAYQLNEHGKYLLMAPSLDRSGEVGFRCAADAP
jgi:formylglycine-generating enzyme required for sulfatase activity